MHLNPDLVGTAPPPVMEAYRWLAAATPDPDRPLINVSQAAPVAPPPEGLRRHLADAILNDTAAHLYGPDLGLPALRQALADQTARIYGGTVAAENVAITAGCNQAFTAAIATLARAGDEVILPTPWYFNHQMWLTMTGIRPVPLPCGDDLLPDPGAAAALIGDRTRALVLVTPNNPTGREYPADLIAAFRDLARARGIALILDETYRDFHADPGAPHDLFTDPGWADTLIHLYSFSKAYRLTGHRVGAMIADPDRLAQAEKYFDSTTICANQIGQRGALWGIENLGQWLAGERDEILARRAAITAAFDTLDGWRLKGCGAYFAYAEHPFAVPSRDLTKHLIEHHGVLLLPATIFDPDPTGDRHVRIAFANLDVDGIGRLFDRLRGVALAPAGRSA